MSGKCIGPWTAGWTAIARGQDYSTLSNGRGSTTLPMQQVGNHPNTSQMHLTWSRHSIRPIQRNQPPKFIKRGPLSYMSLHIFVQLIDYSLYRFFRAMVSFILQDLVILSTSPTPLLPPS